jgi:lipopolysaccharide/colanic/teichoic acid biosynthesis glycosyltransferase
VSSSVIRLAHLAIRRRAAARRSGGVTLPDLEPGPGAAAAIADALGEVTAPDLPVVTPTARPSHVSDSQSVCLAVQPVGRFDADTRTSVVALPSSVTLKRVAVARAIDGRTAVPLHFDLLDASASRSRNEMAIRALNVAFAAVLLLLLAPLMLVVMVAIKLTSPGPVFYRQVRVGLDRRRYRSLTPVDRRRGADRRNMRPDADGRRIRLSTVSVEQRTGGDRRSNAGDRRTRQLPVEQERRSGFDRRTGARVDTDRRKRVADAPQDRRQWNLCGRLFTMYKFRTMRVDAESVTGAVWARPNDPRVTAIGRLLRVCRLDELPQLYNVLKGDMNIVGPRPERPTIVVDLLNAITEYPIRQRTLPGITGLAQISQAPDGTVEDVRVKVRYDLEYLRRRSVLEDLRIMVKTPAVMFLRRSGR